MFELRIEDAISKMVEHMLPIGSTKALHVALRLSLTNNLATRDEEGALVASDDIDANEDPAQACRFVHFLFLRPTNYTKVWSATMSRFGRPKPEDWTMTSDHDSCWRSDGFRPLFHAEMAMHDEVVPKGQDKPNFYHHAHIETILLVDVEHATGNDPRFPHHRKVVKVTW